MAASKKISLVPGENEISVKVEERLLARYLYAPDPSRPLADKKLVQTKPVLWPIYSPSGINVTRLFPFQEQAGETKDHPHHMGLFFTVDRVGGEANNFWGNSTQPLPAIRHQKILKAEGGKDYATLQALSHWIGKDGTMLLEENREMVFRANHENENWIDFEIRLKAVPEEVEFGDTKEGMFAFRVAEWLTEKQTGRYLNSNGEWQEEGVWGKRADWVRLQGEKEGKKIGIIILSHPTSLNSPSYWHARGYGCFSLNPLGQLDFQKTLKVADPQPFNLRLKQGKEALFKYRVIIYEGDYNKTRVDALYREFVH
jgi:hypothetical protein